MAPRKAPQRTRKPLDMPPVGNSLLASLGRTTGARLVDASAVSPLPEPTSMPPTQALAPVAATSPTPEDTAGARLSPAASPGLDDVILDTYSIPDATGTNATTDSGAGGESEAPGPVAVVAGPHGEPSSETDAVATRYEATDSHAQAETAAAEPIIDQPAQSVAETREGVPPVATDNRLSGDSDLGNRTTVGPVLGHGFSDDDADAIPTRLTCDSRGPWVVSPDPHDAIDSLPDSSDDDAAELEQMPAAQETAAAPQGLPEVRPLNQGRFTTNQHTQPAYPPILTVANSTIDNPFKNRRTPTPRTHTGPGLARLLRISLWTPPAPPDLIDDPPRT